MTKPALARLYLDLDTENYARDGVVIDLRGNSGGFASPYALDVFSRRGYLTMTRRGFDPAPGRTYVGQRALGSPTILVTNRQSVSDAENFAEGYRALGLGKVVGEPTAGAVIFTADVPLIDGSMFRIPYSKVQAADGQVLELHPRPVDVTAKRPVGEASAGRDSQLDAAARELLKQIDEGKAAQSAKPRTDQPTTKAGL
jgi:C-terminal processing protease CtpA/Prc